MRQVGTRSEGELMQQDLASEIIHSGKRVKVRRTLPTGEYTYFAVYAKAQALTPTFTHTIRSNGSANTAENDQHDFVCVGKIPMLEKDEISMDGWVWIVSSAAEKHTTGTNVVTHCLCVRMHQKVF